MRADEPKTRRRRMAGAMAAICGGGAAGAVGIGHQAATHGPESLIWQDIAVAAAIMLIFAALVLCAVAARRRCRVGP